MKPWGAVNALFCIAFGVFAIIEYMAGGPDAKTYLIIALLFGIRAKQEEK